MRDLRALQFVRGNGICTGKHFILIAGNLFGNRMDGSQPVIFIIDPDFLRIIDILDLHISFGSHQNADSVGSASCVKLHADQYVSGIFHGNRFRHIHAVFKNSRCLNLRLRVTKDHPGKVDTVNAQVEKSPSCQIRICNSFNLIDPVAEVAVDGSQITNGSISDQFLNHLPGRHVTGPDGLCDQNPSFFCQPDQVFSLTGIYRKGFFTEHISSGFDGQPGSPEMMRVRNGNINEVDVFIRYHLLIAAVCLCKTIAACKFPGSFQIPRADCIWFNIVHFCNGRGHLSGNAAGAHDCHFQHVFSSFFFVLFYCSNSGISL